MRLRRIAGSDFDIEDRKRAEAQLEQKRVSISVDENARRWIAKRGYDPKMGARPMARIIQEHMEDVSVPLLAMHGEADNVQKLLAEGIRIRLCKGAYKEPHKIAFQKKSEVDANYVKLMKILMKSGIYHGLATHDARIIKQAQIFAKREKIAHDAFEFQMLYGIRRDLQQGLVRKGWRMRVYIPFGTEWYPYFMRRLAERPANALFLAKNLLRK